MIAISSAQNPRVKAATKLRDRRHRDKQARIVIDGGREILRAIAAGVRIVEAWTCAALLKDTVARDAAATLCSRADEAFEVTPEVFQRLAFGERADGLLAVAAMPRRSLTTFAALLQQREVGQREARRPVAEPPLVCVLEGVEKPGNVGAVLRSADGAGLSGVIVADAATDLFNPNTIRASLGTVFSLPVCTATTEETLAWLGTSGLAIAAARVEGAVDYAAFDFRGPTAIVLGSEARGLSAAWSRPGVSALRLPMLGAADSLNVSAAAAVLFYEARRQRAQR